MFLVFNNLRLLMKSQRAATRKQQPATFGLGRPFVSPIKQRNKHKSSTYVVPINQDAKRRRLQTELARMMDALDDPAPQPPLDSLDHLDSHTHDETRPQTPLRLPTPPVGSTPSTSSSPPKPRRIHPDEKAKSLYERWNEVLPRLVEPFLQYIDLTCGKVILPTTILETTCVEASCARKTAPVLCLYQNRASSSASIQFCLICTQIFNNSMLPLAAARM